MRNVVGYLLMTLYGVVEPGQWLETIFRSVLECGCALIF